MSKVTNLPEATSVDDNDVLYVVDVSEGATGSRKVRVSTLKSDIASSQTASDTAYERADGLKVDIQASSDDVENALTDLDDNKLSRTGSQAMTGDLNMGSNDITGVGNVDGRDVSVDGTKLDTIETNAKDDQLASEVPYSNATSGLSATEVQGAIDEVEGRLDTAESTLAGHLDGGASKHDASEVDYERLDGSKVDIQPTSDDVEAAVTDLDDNKLSRTGSQAMTGSLDMGTNNISNVGTVDGRDVSTDGTKLDGIEAGATADQIASEVPYSNTTSGLTATDVQAAVDEVEGRLDTAESTLASHLDGGASKHDATEIDYERVDGSKVDIQPTSDDVEAAVTDLDDNKLSRTGSQAMTGSLDMGTNNITNVGTVDGRDVSVDGTKLDGIEAGATNDSPGTVAPPAIAGTGSAGTDTATYANENHTHAHGTQTDGTHHAEATESVNGFLGAADKVKLNDLAFGWVQYQSDTNFTQVNSGFTQMTDWTTDLDSFANSQITRVDGTTFRVEQDCTVEIMYAMEIDVSGNNTGAQARVEINATQLDRSLGFFGSTRANNAESNTLHRTFRVNLVDQDLITFSIGNRENGGSSVTALSQNFTTMMIKVVRLL